MFINGYIHTTQTWIVGTNGYREGKHDTPQYTYQAEV